MIQSNGVIITVLCFYLLACLNLSFVGVEKLQVFLIILGMLWPDYEDHHVHDCLMHNEAFFFFLFLMEIA